MSNAQLRFLFSYPLDLQKKRFFLIDVEYISDEINKKRIIVIKIEVNIIIILWKFNHYLFLINTKFSGKYRIPEKPRLSSDAENIYNLCGKGEDAFIRHFRNVHHNCNIRTSLRQIMILKVS